MPKAASVHETNLCLFAHIYRVAIDRNQLGGLLRASVQQGQIEKGLPVEGPSLEVDLVNQLQNHMILTLEQLKAFHLTVSALMVELAAVRRTTIVTEKARSQYKLNLAKAMRQAKPLLDEAARSFDEQINSVNKQIQSIDDGLSESAGPKFH